MKVILANKLPQLVTVSVKGDDGVLLDLKIQPFASTEPIDVARLGIHARQLIASGHLRQRPV